VNWLVGHQQELLIGILSSAVVAIAGYLLSRWFKSPARHNGGVALTAQGAKVSDSPVASGSGINQSVEHHTHHHYAAATVPAAALPTPAPRKYLGPLPNVKYIRAESVCLREQIGGGLFEEQGNSNALLIRFANEARQEGSNLTARVKAVLIYRYGQREDDVAGSWLGEGRDVSEFSPDSRRHQLIAGVLVDGQFCAITSRSVVLHRRNWYLSDRVELKGFKEGIVVVQLTDVGSNRLLYRGEFVIVTNPLSILPAAF
jgi:hypothetical protein